MRLSFGLLLPAIAGVTHAASASVDGYVFTASKEPSLGTISLTPRQVRVVLAQQLDITKYHSLNAGDNPEKSLELINTLGGQHSKLFDEDVTGTAPPKHLVVFLDISSERSETLKAEWSLKGRTEPSFVMTGNPGRESVSSLVRDMQKQISPLEVPTEQCTLTKVVDVSADECWNEKNGYIMHRFTDDSHDFDTFVKNQDALFRAIESGVLEATFLLMTPSHVKSAAKLKEPWGSYSVPIPDSVHQKRQLEEPMSDIVSSSTSTPSNPQPTSTPLRRLPALCYNTLDSCTTATQNCSGHGKCVRKYGPTEEGSGPSCFSCSCYSPDASDPARKGHWGGAACQKQDISAQFWIIAGFSALLVGIISAAIGAMFSIGSEKLPGVIGAGVAAKTR